MLVYVTTTPSSIHALILKDLFSLYVTPGYFLTYGCVNPMLYKNCENKKCTYCFLFFVGKLTAERREIKKYGACCVYDVIKKNNRSKFIKCKIYKGSLFYK